MPFPPTDWGDWTPEEYEVGAPATSNHFERWFRNPVAMAQGVAGAPRINLAAINRITAGDSIRVRNDPQQNHAMTASNTYQPAPSVIINPLMSDYYIPAFRSMQAGAIRLNFEYRRDPAISLTASARLMRRRAGANQFTTAISTTSSSFVAGVLEIDVIPGDLVALQLAINSASYEVQIRNVRWCVADGEYLWPNGRLFGEIEGNPTLLLP